MIRYELRIGTVACPVAVWHQLSGRLADIHCSRLPPSKCAVVAPFLLPRSMHFPNSSTLVSADESSALIALAWREMFDADTPDSYRPRLFDTHFLVAELAELATLSLRDSRWRNHVKFVQEEIQTAIVAEAHWLADQSWCCGLLEKLTRSESLREINDIATVFSTTAPSPIPTLVCALQREAAELPKNKQRTLAVLEHLGTHAVRLGYLPTDANSAVGDTYSKDVQAVVENIGASLQAQARRFTCIVRLYGNGPTVQSLLVSTDVRLARLSDFPLNETGQRFKKDMDQKREVALAIAVEATTYGRAVDDALRKCRAIVDTFNLYDRPALRINSTVLAYDERESRILDRRTEQSVASWPRRNAKWLARHAQASIGLDGCHEALENALEQHSIALASTDAMAGLVGMWTALECLVGGSNTDSAIDRIVRWVSPTVALRRVDKITRYLAVCCHYFYRTASKPPSALFERSAPYWMSPRDVCEAITGPKENRLIRQLLEDVSSHPLLRFRVYQSWKDMHEPKTVRRRLEDSKQRVAWHLRRIYRARNMAVHMGTTPPYLSALIDHVQYYFSRCVSRILVDLASNPDWSTTTSLEYHLQRFDFIVGRLREAPSEIPATLFFLGDDDFVGFHPWQR